MTVTLGSIVAMATLVLRLSLLLPEGALHFRTDDPLAEAMATELEAFEIRRTEAADPAARRAGENTAGHFASAWRRPLPSATQSGSRRRMRSPRSTARRLQPHRRFRAMDCGHSSYRLRAALFAVSAHLDSTYAYARIRQIRLEEMDELTAHVSVRGRDARTFH